MSRIYFNFIIVLLLILTACTTHHLQNPVTNDIPLNQLINQLPAKDSIEAKLVFGAIINHGQEGVSDICRYLNSPNKKIQLQAEYALHGLAIYVTDSKREHLRPIYLSGLSGSLKQALPVEKKTFIINQIMITGGDESVSLLGSYIDDTRLYQPAIQALLTIGTKSAGKTLLDALPRVEQPIKESVIQALGEMRFEPASGEVLNLLTDPDHRIKQVSAFALSNIGVKEALVPIRSLVETDQRFLPDYLRLAERFGEKGDLESCRVACEDLINSGYPDNTIINALYLQVKFNPQKAINSLYKFISSPNKKLRMASLNLVITYDKSDYVPRLISISRESEPEIQSDILNMFGEQKCLSALPYVRETLTSPSPVVRMTSLFTLSKIDKQNSLPELVSVLKDSLDEYETIRVRNFLNTITDTVSINIILDSFFQFPAHSKVIILDVLTDNEFDRQAWGATSISILNKSTPTKYYLSSLKSGDHNVRSAALTGLERFGNDTLLEELIVFLLDPKNEKEQTLTIKTINSIIKRSQSKKENQTLLKKYYENATINEKILFLRLLKSIGSDELLDLTARELDHKKQILRLEAIRTLSEWPDESALDKLIEIGYAHRDEKYRIIAQRGALRLLRENPIGDQRAVGFYKDIIRSDLRPEEKRQVLAGLAEIRTVSSLELIATYLDDPVVSQEAMIAVLSFNQNEMHIPQPPEGFISLFNGENLDGWKGLVENPVKRAQMSEEELRIAQIEADSLMKKHWHVLDRILYFDGGGSHLCTVDDFSDFELFVDWKIEKKGDSGIYLRGSPQVQIWDPAIWPEGSGGLYNNQNYPGSPLKKADNPVGDWNTFHIIMRGEKVTVYLNDTLVVDNVKMENYWERDKPIYSSGQIELQSHNTPLYFRNIYIRELEPQKPLIDGSLFNGKDLDGWQVIGTATGSWQTKDGILFTEGEGGGWLSTRDQFADFELELEFRLPEGGNSGVFIRAPHQGDPAYTGIEIQILDDMAQDYSNLKPWQYTGSLYGLKGPEKHKPIISGEWHKMKIYFVGPHINVYLNNEQLINANLIDFMDMENTHPGIKRRKGYIGLQNHSTKIEFRNIKIREIVK